MLRISTLAVFPCGLKQPAGRLAGSGLKKRRLPSPAACQRRWAARMERASIRAESRAGHAAFNLPKPLGGVPNPGNDADQALRVRMLRPFEDVQSRRGFNDPPRIHDRDTV